jgi:hypothetical protein
MSDIHIYIEREQPVKVITLEPSGKRGPAGPNSVTSATTSDGTAELSLASLEAGSRDGLIIRNSDGDQVAVIGKDNSIDGESGTTSGIQFGFQTVASGNHSFAIGAGATASGDYSYASGANTIASAAYSHAEGNTTTASGINSHAEGDFTTASGGNSHAEGSNTTASGLNSHAGGLGSTASGDASYAQGTNAKAIHDGASVESDSEAADVESTTTDEKTFRFANGYRFLGGSATFDAGVTVEGTLTADHIHGNLAGSVYAHVRAGEALAKGDPVYISGSHGSGENLIPIVSKADASNAAKMPAVGIMDAALANNANGHMVITGTITDLNTNAYAVNSVLYVASGGGFTATPPAANSQAVAIVERSNTNNGAVIVKVNGLASNGGNGASDANKLVRFTSTGGISQTGGTMTDTTYAGTASFTSTTRPTSAGTGTPAATSLITRDDTDLLRLHTSNFVVSNFTGATAVAGGGGGASATLLYAAANSSTTNGNYYTYLIGGSGFFSGNINGDRTTANFSRKIIMSWDIIVIAVASTGNSESRYLWPVNSTYTTGRLTAKGFGFIVINTTVYGCSHDGTTHYLTSGITFTANTLHTCTAISNGAGSVSFYVDGALLGTLTGPTGTQSNARNAAINCETGSSGISQWFACQQFQLITRI